MTHNTPAAPPGLPPMGIPPIQRCAIAHQQAHEELGTTCGSDKSEEEQANRLAAMRLLPVRTLATAVTMGGTPAKIARALGVTTDTLYLRERHLHPAERAFITSQVKAHEIAS